MALIANFCPKKLLPTVLVLAVAVLAGCNSAPTDTQRVADYTTQGVLVQEMNVNHAYAAVRFQRNDTTITNAAIHIAGAPTAFWASYNGIDSAYQALLSPAAVHAGDEAYFRTADASRFKDSVLVAIVDTFSITDNIDPPNHQLVGAGQVSLEWTACSNTQGYILAAVKTSLAYTGVGYSALAPGANAGTIPPEAFLDPISSQPDTGLYNICVYAYSGSPDSALAGKFLPVPLPQQLAGNIAHSSLTGRFGTVTVTVRDTIRVLVGR
jgi:hypothetical protein